jgi:hypothetical protein
MAAIIILVKYQGHSPGLQLKDEKKTKKLNVPRERVRKKVICIRVRL